MSSELYDSIRPIRWGDDGLYLLDQRRLPAEEVELHLTSSADVATAIRNMVVRGAPAIGITAAYGAVLALQQAVQQSPHDWHNKFEAQLSVLQAARPTAINLAWALARIRRSVDAGSAADPVAAALAMARQIHEQDIRDNHIMGELGADLFSRWQQQQPASAVLTHCNAGALATGGYGTALGVVRSLYARKLIEQVFADETRPWLQGARLTAWELEHDGIPSCLLVDSAAAALMQSGAIAAVIVGSDRIAANGDVVNKIGTYAVALAARYHNIPFMVVAPTSTVDMSVSSGKEIPIEQRQPEELLCFGEQRVTSANAKAWNPVFDVTPASLVSAIVTEKGVIESPDEQSMKIMMNSGH